MIETFVGEFLLHDAALDYVGNACSHNCEYCFANNSNPTRKENIKSTISFLKNVGRRKSLESELIRLGYPICLSNKSDPFSRNNHVQTLAILPYLSSMKNPIFFQTKTGFGIDRALDILDNKKNVVWYITLTTLNENVVKKIETGAPTIKQRWETIEKIRKKGYYVCLGINPYVKQWLPNSMVKDYEKMMDSVGVTDILIQPLHFNRMDVKKFKTKKIEKFDATVLSEATNIKKEIKLRAQDLWKTLSNDGYNPFIVGQPFYSKMTDNMKNALNKTFPNLHQFNNYILTNRSSGDIIKEDDFVNFFKKDNKALFDIKHKGISKYLFKISRSVWKGNLRIQNINDYESLIREIWRNGKVKFSPKNQVMYETLDNSSNLKLIKN